MVPLPEIWNTFPGDENVEGQSFSTDHKEAINFESCQDFSPYSLFWNTGMIYKCFS